MRCLGEIRGRRATEQLVAHFLVLDIDTHIEAVDRPDASPDTWELWVKDENKVPQASSEFEQYLKFSSDPKFAQALEKANRILETKASRQEEAVRKHLANKEPAEPKLLRNRRRFPPLTTTLLALCVVVGLVTNFSQPGTSNDFGKIILQQLSFLAPQEVESNPAASLKQGEFWRAITPVFLHVGPLHLLINMFMLVSLGRLVEHWIGTPKFALLVLTLAIIPNLFQGLLPETLLGSPNFAGISGVLYGLFGYVWVRTSINTLHGIAIPTPIVVMVLGLIMLGIFDVFGDEMRMANLAHVGGLVVGCMFGYSAEQETQVA